MSIERSGGRSVSWGHWLKEVWGRDIIPSVSPGQKEWTRALLKETHFGVIGGLLEAELRKSDPEGTIRRSPAIDAQRVRAVPKHGYQGPLGTKYDAFSHKVHLSRDVAFEEAHRLGIDERLVALNMIVHESTHAAGFINDGEGGLIQIASDPESGEEVALFYFLNEGVTDLIADDVFMEYLSERSFFGFGVEEGRAILEKLDNRTQEKQLALLFSEVMGRAFGIESGAALASLKRGMFRGLNLSDPEFSKTINDWAGYDLIKKIAQPIRIGANKDDELMLLNGELRRLLYDQKRKTQ